MFGIIKKKMLTLSLYKKSNLSDVRRITLRNLYCRSYPQCVSKDRKQSVGLF